MPRSSLTQTRPEEGFYTSGLPSVRDLPIRTFLPAGYEPNYPYPLVVLFHDENSNEEEILEMAPRISRRNHILISLRGPKELGARQDGAPGYSWGIDGEYDSLIEEYLLRAVEQTLRNYHVHSERIFLGGMGEGATTAYRLGLGMPDRIGGIISINGLMPRSGAPLFRLQEIRGMRVLIAHAALNQTVPIELARRDFRVLYSAGVDVTMVNYPNAERMHPNMLRDLNRWIIDGVNQSQEFDIVDDEEAE